jgi:hypothetical protein
MAFWLEILREVSNSEMQQANEIFNFDLPLALRNFSYLDEERYYQGAIPEMVRAFSAKLPEKERQTAQSRENDLIDFVLDSALNQIKRSLRLLRFCLEFSDYDLKTLAREFPYWEGYKRDETHKQKYIADILRSVSEAGISLPQDLEEIGLTEGEAKYGFSEIALIKRWNMERTWNDFKKKQEIGGSYKCLDERNESENPEVYNEALEYDIVAIGEAAGNFVEDESLSFLELKELATKLTPEIETHLEDFHNRKPKHGYRPIAFHKAHWDLMEKYNVIPFRLKTADPECRSDNDLAEHIGQNYREVEKPSRQNINERRTKYQRGAEEKIKQRVVEFINIGEI